VTVFPSYHQVLSRPPAFIRLACAENILESLAVELRRVNHMKFIILSAIIGTSAFNASGRALRTASPVGLLATTIIAGAIAAAAGETVGEMV
jgi:amino acid permease